MAAILFAMGMNHVRNRYIAARKVSDNPQLVYWAQPTTNAHTAVGKANDCKILILHLRDGTQIEVGLPPAEMRKCIEWLTVQNPSIRLGAYDVSS